MAISWYLLDKTTRPNSLGGYEDESFNDYKDDAFAEALSTNIASDVELYYSDLTLYKKTRAIIEGETADTQLKSLERTALFSIGETKAGMYMFYDNMYWLITGYPGNNKVFEKVTLSLCQYKIKWQNSNGEIIERWGNFKSASKYDVGEYGNKTIILASNNYSFMIPIDKESYELEEKRVFIDLNKENPTKVYKITRSDDPLYEYGVHGGCLNFIADRTEFNPKTDNQELMLCDYINTALPPSELPKPKDIITYIMGSKNIKIGISKKYSVVFKDEIGEVLDYNAIEFSWQVSSNDFDIQNIDIETADNNIELLVNDEMLIGKNIKLSLLIDNEISKELNIEISGLY